MKFFKKKISKISIVTICFITACGGYTLFTGDYGYLLTFKDRIVSPILLVQASIAHRIHAFGDYFKRQSLLCERVLELEQVANDLQSRLIDLEAERLFIQETQELIDYRKDYAVSDAQLARILLLHLDDVEHACFIDRGASHQTAVDSAVVYKNCLLGRVTQVYPTYSKVMLTTDRNCKVAVVCVHTKTAGIWEGLCCQSSGKLRHIGHMQTLEEGDLLVCTGEGLVYPYGFAVGMISNFERTSVDYNVSVAPILDVTKLRYCYVIPPKNAVFDRGEKNDLQI